MHRIIAAGERYEIVQPGIRSWHSFCAGPHYDPANTSFGALIGVDEHLVEPGAGFAMHAHRGVDIVSWVLSGVLRHEDAAGRVQLVSAGEVQLQSTGSGIHHAERNASSHERLRFVQTTVIGPGVEPRYRLGRGPVDAGPGRFTVVSGPALVEGGWVHLHVVEGRCALAGGAVLGPGDSLRADQPVEIISADEVLVWTAPLAATVES